MKKPKKLTAEEIKKIKELKLKSIKDNEIVKK
jgi:hypothetical protein